MAKMKGFEISFVEKPPWKKKVYKCRGCGKFMKKKDQQKYGAICLGCDDDLYRGRFYG